MLLAFTCENFKSIRDLQTLSLEARADDHLDGSHVFSIGKRRLLRSVAIYGPNASGKSNVLGALRWMREFVRRSTEGQSADETGVEPFLLSTITEKEPSHFEIEFLIEEVRFRYGFQVNRTSVVSEWLFRRRGTAKEVQLFTRERQKIHMPSDQFREGKGLEAKTRANALFLTVCANFNGSVADAVVRWMTRLWCITGLSDVGLYGQTAEQLEIGGRKPGLVDLARKADFQIMDLRSDRVKVEASDLPPHAAEHMEQQASRQSLYRRDIKTVHQRYDAKGHPAGLREFDLEKNESRGTQKFVALSGPILTALEEGGILVIDEFEAKLHPLLTRAILDLFHGRNNKQNAQLIVATHEVLLMEPERMRRDQIWFCEKDEQGATDLYTLADFESDAVRPSTKFSRQYLLGLFGAVPKLAHFQEALVHAPSEMTRPTKPSLKC